MSTKSTKKITVKKVKAATPKSRAKAARKPDAPATARARDPRLPAPGGVIERIYKNRKIMVQVTDGGFVHEGVSYPSLTALARKITNYRTISGPAFFAPRTGRRVGIRAALRALVEAHDAGTVTDEAWAAAKAALGTEGGAR
jgi:hypothetical protein